MSNENHKENKDDNAINDEIEIIEINEMGQGEDADLIAEIKDFEMMEDLDDTEIDEDYIDNSISIFDKHESYSVFCIAVDPSENYVATGGQDDKCYVWKIEDLSIYLTCYGHKDSVTHCDFNEDGSLLASVDLSGIVQVWKISEGGSLLWSGECGDVEWSSWHHKANVLAVGNTDGTIWIWKIPSGECKILSYISASACGSFLVDGLQLVSAYFDGSVKVWNVKNETIIHNITNSINKAATCLTYHHLKPLVLVGFIGTFAKLINYQNGKEVHTFDCGLNINYERDEDSIEAVGFCNSHNIATTCTLKGQIQIWDLVSFNERHRLNYEVGFVKLQFQHNSSNFFVCGLDGVTKYVDGKNGKILSEFKGHQGSILDFRLCSHGDKFITTSDDGTARIFNIS